MPVPDSVPRPPNQLTHDGALRLVHIAEDYANNHIWDDQPRTSPIAVCVVSVHRPPGVATALLTMDGTPDTASFEALLRCTTALTIQADSIMLPSETPVPNQLEDNEEDEEENKQEEAPGGGAEPVFSPHGGGVVLRDAKGDIIGALGIAGLASPQSNHHLAFTAAKALSYRSGQCDCGGPHDSIIFS